MTGSIRSKLTTRALFAMLAAILALPEAASGAGNLSATEQLFVELGKLPPAERQAKILEAAKKEGKGSITIGGSASERNHFKLLTDLYPTLEYSTRGLGSDKAVAAFLAEEVAGKHLSDAIAASVPDMGDILRKGFAAEYPTPAAGRIEKRFQGFLDPQNRYLTYYLLEHGISYNPQTLKAMNIAPPKSYEDLCDPRFKGQVSFEPSETRFMVGLWEVFGHDEKKLVDWMTCIGKNTSITMKGYTTRTTLMMAGDHAISGDTLIYYGTSANAKSPDKAPFAVAYDAPLITMARGGLISKNAQNPMKAALYIDFLLSEDSQKFLFKDYRGTVVGAHPYLPEHVTIVPTSYATPELEQRLHNLWRQHISNTRG